MGLQTLLDSASSMFWGGMSNTVTLMERRRNLDLRENLSTLATVLLGIPSGLVQVHEIFAQFIVRVLEKSHTSE
jgi:hypothetical protein